MVPSESSSPPAGDASAVVRAEQIRLLASGTSSSVMVSIVNVVLVAYVQRTAVDYRVIAAWSAALIAILLLRLALNGFFLRAKRLPAEAGMWARRFTLMTFLAGAGWGAMGILMTPTDSLPHQVFTAFVAAGMGAGAMASLYPLRTAFYAFMLPLLLPLIARFYWEPDELHVIMGTMVALFLLFVLGAGRRLRDVLVETLNLRIANDGLIGSLTAEKARIEALNQELRAEGEERARAEKAREGSEMRYRNVVEGAADAILVHEATGRLTDVNQQACDMLGYDRAELLTLSVWDIEKNVSREDLEDLWRVADPAKCPVTLEGMQQRRDGGRFPVEVRLSVLEDRAGKQFVAVVRDITERKKVDRMKSEFISTVSHELRTPLTSIIGSLGMLLQGGGGALPEKAAAMIGLAERNAKRLIDLVNDILDFEKLESGRMNFAFADVDLAALVLDAVESHKGFADHFSVRYRLEGALPHVKVHGDGGRLSQVLSNLLSNAAKFSHAESDVTVSLSVSAGLARISIVDQGDGIPAAFHGQIFKRFAQAGDATTRRQGGTGLGLAISKAIVDAHNGSIGFETEEGKGSVFHVDLPVAGPEGRQPVSLPGRG